MPRYLCVKKCLHKGRLYEPGEAAEFPAGEAVPAHFEPLGRGRKAEKARRPAQASMPDKVDGPSGRLIPPHQAAAMTIRRSPGKD